MYSIKQFTLRYIIPPFPMSTKKKYIFSFPSPPQAMTTARPAATAGSTSCLAATATSASSAIGASSRTSARMTTTAVSTASALTSAPLRSPRSSAIVSRGDSDPSARKVSSHSAFYGEIIEDSSSFKYLGFFFLSFSLIIDFKAIFFHLALCVFYSFSGHQPRSDQLGNLQQKGT